MRPLPKSQGVSARHLPALVIESLIRECATPAEGVAKYAHRTHRGGPLDFSTHPFQREIITDPNKRTVVQKSVQCGFSEITIARALAYCSRGWSVFYVLPTEQVRNRFVRNRVDTAIAGSKYYQWLADSADDRYGAGRSAADAVMLKQLGTASLFFVGSNSLSSFGEAVADVVMIDEYDRCRPEGLALAEDRIGASALGHYHTLGNPTRPGRGISELYANSDRRVWMIQCTHCNHRQPIDWWLNVVRQVDDGVWAPRHGEGDTMAMVCAKCAGTIERYGPGEWVPEFPGRDESGYHVNQLFGGRFSLARLFKRWLAAQSNATLLAAFYNSILGLPHASDDIGLSVQLLDRCVGTHGQVVSGKRCVMGVDVGKVLHVVVIDPGTLRLHNKGMWVGKSKVVKLAVLAGDNKWEQLHNMALAFDAIVCMDGRPETTAAQAVQKRLGKNRCLLADHIQSEAVAETKVEAGGIVRYRRTATLDDSHAAIVQQLVQWPADAATVPDFYDHMTVLAREYDEETRKATWTNDGKPDHFRFAFNFGWMGLKIKVARPNVFLMVN